MRIVRRRGGSAAAHQRRLPGWGRDLQGHAIGARGQQELASPRGFEQRALGVAELEVPLQPSSLPGSLRAEEVDGRVRGDDRARLAAEHVPRILGGEDQRAVVLADPPGERDDELPDRGVLEQQAQLVDHEQTPPVASLDAAPQRLGEQKVDRRHHLRAQLSHAEDDQRALEVDVRAAAEQVAEAAGDPAPEDPPGPGRRVEPPGHVSEQRFVLLRERVADRLLELGPLRRVEPAAHDRAQVDRVRDDRAQRLLPECRPAHVEHVEGVGRAQLQPDVEAAEPGRQPSVLVLGVDHEHLGARVQRAHRERRQEVGLARARVAEDPDVGVRVAGLVERVEEDRLPGCAARADDEAALGLEVRVEPGEEGRERARVQDAGALKGVDAERCRRHPPLALPERAAVEVAEGRTAGRLHLGRGGLQLSGAVGRDCQVQPDVERAVLSRVHAPLQVLDRRHRAADRGVGRARLVELGGPELDQLPLQEGDDPRRRQPLRMPAEREVQARRHEPEEPSGLQVAAGVAVDVPGAVQAGVVPPPARSLHAVARGGRRIPGCLVQVRRAQHAQRPSERRGRPPRGHERDLTALGGRGRPQGAGEPEVLEPAVIGVLGDLGGRVGGGLLPWRPAQARLEVHDDLEAGVEAVEEGTEGRDPPAPVVLRRVQVPERAGSEHDGVRGRAEQGARGASKDVERAHAFGCTGAASLAATGGSELPGCAGRAGTGAGAVTAGTAAGVAAAGACAGGSGLPGHRSSAGRTTRTLARRNITRSAAHRSRGRPRQRPHARVTPPSSSGRARARRTGAAPHRAFHTQKAARPPITRYPKRTGVNPSTSRSSRSTSRGIRAGMSPRLGGGFGEGNPGC